MFILQGRELISVSQTHRFTYESFVATFAGKTEFAAVFAELMAAVVGSIFMVALRKRYHY